MCSLCIPEHAFVSTAKYDLCVYLLEKFKAVQNMRTGRPMQNKATACTTNLQQIQTRMWANAQRDGRPAEYRWSPLFNAAKFG